MAPIKGIRENVNVVGTRKPRSKVPKVRTFFDPKKISGLRKNERQILVILLFRKQKPVLLLLWIFCFAASFCTIPIRFPDLPRSGLIFVRFLRTGCRWWCFVKWFYVLHFTRRRRVSYAQRIAIPFPSGVWNTPPNSRGTALCSPFAHFPQYNLVLGGGKRDVLWETCKWEMPDLDIAVIHAVTQKLLAHVTRKF